MKHWEVALKHFGEGGVIIVSAESCTFDMDGNIVMINQNGEMVWGAAQGEWIFFGLVDEEKLKGMVEQRQSDEEEKSL